MAAIARDPIHRVAAEESAHFHESSRARLLPNPPRRPEHSREARSDFGATE
jgi:hypothetical protein